VQSVKLATEIVSAMLCMQRAVLVSQAWGGPAGEQLRGERPGCPGGRQVDHEPAACPGCQEGQWDPGVH